LWPNNDFIAMVIIQVIIQVRVINSKQGNTEIFCKIATF
jgi:hypothetical protein